MKACNECENCYWDDGVPITYNCNMPVSAIGDYLPGDEPGYKCLLNEEYCDNIRDKSECPKEDDDE